MKFFRSNPLSRAHLLIPMLLMFAFIYLKLDEHIKSSVERHLESLGVRLIGKNKRRHMKLLGIPSLTAMVEYKRKSTSGSVVRDAPLETQELASSSSLL